MKSHFYHIQVNVDFKKNKDFYYALMQFLGWEIIFDTEDMIGFKSGEVGDIWFVNAEKNEEVDYDKKGVNHIALRVENQNDIDEIADFLKKNDTKPLFDTPKHREEFASADDQTYYQVMFESPDKILFEIVYIGEK